MVGPGRTGAFLAMATVALAAGSCGDDRATVVFSVKTDLVPGIELVGTRLRAPPEADPRDRFVMRGEPFIEGVRIAELDDVKVGSVLRIETELLLASGVSLRRITHVDVSRAGTILVTILVTRDCRGTTCGEGEVCHGGACADARCTPETIAECPAPECASPADCPAPASCAAARCESGVCIDAPVPGGCDAASWCDPDYGCRALDATPDAGTPQDAGRRDAGGPMPDAGPPCASSDCFGDRDCDWLPDARDPAVDVCNPLVYESRFHEGVVFEWAFDPEAAWSPGGDAVRFAGTTTAGTATLAVPRPLPEADQLVEMSLVPRALGALPWEVGLQFRQEGTGAVSCLIVADSRLPTGGVQMVTETGMGGTQRSWGAEVSMAPGVERIIQGRVLGAGPPECLYYDSRSLRLARESIDGEPAEPGSVRLRAQNVDVEIRWVRVFDITP